MRGGGRGGTRGLTRLPPSLQRLGGVEIKALNVAGIAVNTWGGAWYTVAKYRMRLRRDREKGEKGEKGGGGGRPPGLPPLAGGPLAKGREGRGFGPNAAGVGGVLNPVVARQDTSPRGGGGAW